MLGSFGDREGEASIFASCNGATAYKPQKFSVVWRDLSLERPYTTTGTVSVDGIECGGKLILPSTLNPSGSVCKSEYVTSSRTCRPFMFSRIELTGLKSPGCSMFPLP
jgi:hypothetical protein